MTWSRAMQRADHHVATTTPPADEVRVFIVSLDLPEDALERARQLLAPDERARADAFLRPRDRIHFTAARAWLRRVLAAHLGRDPAGLSFRYGRHGKPCLPEVEGALDFNLSHSGGVALLALSPGFPLGADIEAIRPVEEKVAERFFSAAEVRALAALPERERPDAFFRCWCRKEAYLKALGSGLATPLDAFSVSLGPDEPARLLQVDGEPDAPAIWQLAHLDPAPGFAAAVAAPHLGWRLHF